MTFLSLTCTENEDGDLLIEWDPNDPDAIMAGINDWSEQDWTDMLMAAAERVLAEAGEKIE